jgi:hypothetical protein
MEKYIHTKLTDKEADEMIKKWGENAVSYISHDYGDVYWNKSTGEILWRSFNDHDSHVELLKA